MALGVALALGACASTPPPPAPAPLVQAPPKPAPRPLPDWFHRELALARHARATHLPHTDLAGAQDAYNKVMLPACHRVALSGPDKYRARCSTLVQNTVARRPAGDLFSCNDQHDDSLDDPAQQTACSD